MLYAYLIVIGICYFRSLGEKTVLDIFAASNVYSISSPENQFLSSLSSRSVSSQLDEGEKLFVSSLDNVTTKSEAAVADLKKSQDTFHTDDGNRKVIENPKLPVNKKQDDVYTVRAEPKTVQSFQTAQPTDVTSEYLDINDDKNINLTRDASEATPTPSSNAEIEEVIALPPAQQEDIPSFREWTEKHLAEEEKEKGENNTNTSIPLKRKIPNKNFASLDCGAKIISTNSEAKSAGSLLSPSRDEYLLNACNSRIWFVVELCEAVQVKKIDLANFELFSSSPKEFSVSVSDRFPSRDWSNMGNFVAKDEKVIQSFDLQPHHFTKYIRIDIHSHYGKEHFCPISLFRVYGTSEFEVLEIVDEHISSENDGVDNDDDAVIGDDENSEKSQNIFGTARDAVINIVRKAAEVLSHSSKDTNDKVIDSNESINKTSNILQNDGNCITPRYMVMCDQCSEQLFARVYQLMSCRMKQLSDLVQLRYIWEPILKHNLCLNFGIHLQLIKLKPDDTTYDTANESDLYAIKLLPEEYSAAFCNLIIISENGTPVNLTYTEFSSNQTIGRAVEDVVNIQAYVTAPGIIIPSSMTQNVNISTGFKIIESVPSSVNLNSNPPPVIGTLIKPTKTLNKESESQNGSNAILNNEYENSLPIHSTVTASPKIVDSAITPNGIDNKHNETKVLKDSDSSVEISDESISLDSLISELEQTENEAQNVIPSSAASAPNSKPKESVFVRLANRIKALERNMSLSGQYLEELSRRYKRQVEDMQRLLTETADERQKSKEREEKQIENMNSMLDKIATLTIAVDSLTAERESWSHKALMIGEHSMIIMIEIFLLIGIMCLCHGIPLVEISKRKISLDWTKVRQNSKNDDNSIKRRQSVDDLLCTKATKVHKRRPSAEALRMDGSTHKDLLIYDTNRGAKSERRKRKKRKELLLKSSINAINLEAGGDMICNGSKIKPAKHYPISRCVSTSGIEEFTGFQNLHNGTFKKPSSPSKEISAPPLYIKTAMSVRSKRITPPPPINGNGNLILSPLDDISSESSVPSTPRKEKKVNSIKKIVKKFF